MSGLVSINLIPSNDYERNNYGIILVSETLHRFEGSGIHNRSFNHELNVWLNSNGHDPSGKPTDQDLAFLWSAQASVISARVLAQPLMGETLHLGDVVVLRTGGREVGQFLVAAKPLHDPHLERIVR